MGVSSIEIDVTSVSSAIELSDFADCTWTLLPTSDSLLINEITRVHNSDEYIYLSDVSSVYKFSYDGKLVARISKQGKGADEYLNISDFQVCKDGNVWILSRNMKSLLLYSWENELIRKIKLDEWVQDICLLGDKMLLYAGNETNDHGKQLLLLDMETEKIENSYKSFDPYKSKYLHIKGNNTFFCDSESNCYYSELFNDTIYRFTDEGISPSLVFDWGGHNVPRSFYEKDYQNIMDFFQSFHSQGTYAYGMNLFAKTGNAIWVSYFYQGKCFMAIRPDDGDNSVVSDKLNVDGYSFDFLEKSLFVQNNGSIVIPLDAVEVKECPSLKTDAAFKESLKDIPEDSNPLLLIINPK